MLAPAETDAVEQLSDSEQAAVGSSSDSGAEQAEVAIIAGDASEVADTSDNVHTAPAHSELDVLAADVQLLDDAVQQLLTKLVSPEV
jgi:hypothetical protein